MGNPSRPDQLIKLVWCSPHPTHYNSYLFEHLGKIKQCSFQAVYFAKGLEKYPWKSDFTSTYSVHYLRKVFFLDWNFIRKRIRAKRELLVVAGWNEPTMLVLLFLFACIGRKFILYSDTPDLKPRKGFKQFLRKQVLNYIFKRCFRFLVTGSAGVKNAALLGVPPRILVNFPFATNIDFFTPQQGNSLEHEELIYISSGRLDNQHKGYHIAIEAFALLKKHYPQYAFHYRIAGSGPDREQIEALIKQRGLEHHISLVGWLEPSELLAFYQSGNVFLHSSFFDPFPNAVLEAMACGLPILGSDAAGSVLDRVIEGENGYIHQVGNATDLFQKMVLMHERSPVELRMMGLKARQTAEQWPVSYHVNTIESIIQDL